MNEIKKLIIPISGIYDEQNNLCDTLDLIPGYIQSIKDNDPNIFYEEALNVIIEEWNSPIDLDDPDSVASNLNVNDLDVDKIIITLNNSMEYLKGQIDEAIEGEVTSKLINQNEILSCNKVSEDLMVLKLEDKISLITESIKNGSFNRSESTVSYGNELININYTWWEDAKLPSVSLKSPYPSKEFIKEHDELIKSCVEYMATVEIGDDFVDTGISPWFEELRNK